MTDMRAAWSIIYQAFLDFLEDECPRMAAALAYYLFFALPALLVLIVFVAGTVASTVASNFVNQQAVEDHLQTHFEETIGEAGAKELKDILDQARNQPHGWAIGTLMLV